MPKIVADEPAFECDVKDEVAIIRLRKNATRMVTDAQAHDKYSKLLEKIEVDSAILGLIFINDEAFSGEAELKALTRKIIEDTSLEKALAYRFRHWTSQHVRQRLYFQKPLVVGLAGPITMEELGIYLICDRLIVSDHFSVRNVGLDTGMPPGPGLTYLLPRLLGPRRALKLLTEDRVVTALEASELGLVDRVVPQAEFEQECLNEIQKLIGLPLPFLSETRDLIFSQLDKFEEHLERSTRQKIQFIQYAKRQ